jgi:hypothetical protein
MRVSCRCLIALLVFAAADTRGQTVPAAAASPKIAVPNVFSYQPPNGWVVLRVSGMPYPLAMEKKGEDAGLGFTPAMITVNSDVAPLPLVDWCSKSLAKNKAQLAAMNAQIGDLQPFPTDVLTVIGYRAPVDLTAKDKKLHYVMYFFNGSGNTKLAVTCICSAADADRYAPVFEAAMRTFYPY